MDEQPSHLRQSSSPTEELVRLLALGVIRHQRRMSEKNTPDSQPDWTLTDDRACMSAPQQQEADHARRSEQ